MARPVDLKQLIRLIHDQKDVEANLILDEGCVIHTEDAAPLVKVINYFMNYLSGLTDRPLEIALDLMPGSFLLSLMAFTDKQELDQLSDNLEGALKDYNASFEVKHDQGNYVQIKISFSNN